jgi:hypothetical protein
VTCISSSPYTVPETVSTGDAGTFPSTSCDDNTTRESNWRVEDAKDGKIYFILSYTTKDEFGSIISTGEDKYTVDSNNELVGIEVTTTEISTGYTTTVTDAVQNGDANISPTGSTITISGQQSQPSQPTLTNPQAKLLFKSSFETSDVCSRSDSPPCNTPYQCGVDAVLKGGDPGYDWLSDFPTGGSDNYFNDVIGESPDCCPSGCLCQSLSECHELDVVTTLDKNGQQTKALYWKLKKDCSQHSKSRVQFNMGGPEEYNPVYFRYWVKFEDGWPQNSQGKWRNLWQFYYENNDWSNALVFNWGSEGLVWVLKGSHYGPDCCEIQWRKTSNKQIPKGGEWFLVETYLYSHYTDGQIIVKINGEEIFNHQGRTNRRPGQKPATAAMFKTYGDGWGQFEQWIDDFEMWTADPGYVDR